MHELMDDERARQEADNARIALEQRLADMRACVGTVQGRHLMYEILFDLGTFNAVHGDRSAGRHEAGLYIVSRIKEAGMPYWLKMIEENEK